MSGFRKEKKFLTTTYDFHKFKNKLKYKMAKIIHPKRIISSTYFDNKLFSSYNDSEEGVVPRRKIRVREYPEQSDNSKLEIKISSIEGRYKTSNIINNVYKKKIYLEGYLDKFYGFCNPVINVSYTREYFQYNQIRLTFDSGIKYRSLKNIVFYDSYNVVEIKCNDLNIVENYINEFNLKESRFSKYCRGIKQVYFKN
tara:strand:+ start:163 stop:756 length:594 start_codon:yes stop_codon:yes gene_type:complete